MFDEGNRSRNLQRTNSKSNELNFFGSTKQPKGVAASR